MLNIASLKKLSSTKSYPKGAEIIKEGDRTNYSMYVLLQGSVVVYKNDRHQQRQKMTTLNPGAFFGEMSLFMQLPRSATVVTQEASLLLEIDEQNAIEAFRLHPDLCTAVMSEANKRSEANRQFAKNDAQDERTLLERLRDRIAKQ